MHRVDQVIADLLLAMPDELKELVLGKSPDHIAFRGTLQECKRVIREYSLEGWMLQDISQKNGRDIWVFSRENCDTAVEIIEELPASTRTLGYEHMEYVVPELEKLTGSLQQFGIEYDASKMQDTHNPRVSVPISKGRSVIFHTKSILQIILDEL